MKRILMAGALLLAVASPAVAQNRVVSASDLGASFAPRTSQGRVARSGFTVLVNLGVGVQRDEFFGETAEGLAGANLGLGAFVTDNLAILARFSGTNVSYGFADQVSGVFGGTVQYWVNSRFAVEGGAGSGYWRLASGSSQYGFGIIVAATGSVVSRGNHHLIAGAEYAPAFTDSGTVHSIGFTVGYQFIRQ